MKGEQFACERYAFAGSSTDQNNQVLHQLHAHVLQVQ